MFTGLGIVDAGLTLLLRNAYPNHDAIAIDNRPTVGDRGKNLALRPVSKLDRHAAAKRLCLDLTSRLGHENNIPQSPNVMNLFSPSSERKTSWAAVAVQQFLASV